MDPVIFDGVTKIFRERRGFFPWRRGSEEKTTPALRDVTLSVPAGTVLVLLGPNGSGKTTLLKLVSTMLLPDFGRVWVQGADTLRDSNRARRHMGIAIAAERSFFPRLTARENLDFFATLEDVPTDSRSRRIEWVLHATGLSETADKQVMTFSSGMYQRLGTARALLKDPSVLLLDEPTRSLDPGATTHFWGLVRDLAGRGCTILLATHNFDEALAIGDTVAVLNNGELVDCWDEAQISGREELRSRYLRSAGELDVLGDLRARCTS